MPLPRRWICWPDLVVTRMPYADKVRRAAYMLMWQRAHPGRQTERNHRIGTHRPFNENRECASYLGVHIAERALSNFFDHIERMPDNNPGFDFICGKGFKIDVKSSCLHHRLNRTENWDFGIRHNGTADYFLCLGFDDRDSLNPLRIWLIPGNVINRLSGLQIPNSGYGISKWSKYERPIDRVIECCNTIREGAMIEV